MKPGIIVPDSMSGSLREFLDAEGIGLAVSATEGIVTIVPCTEHRESSLSTLYAGGWIACATALAMADKLGIASEQLGKLLNHLNVRVRHCGLGCFP